MRTTRWCLAWVLLAALAAWADPLKAVPIGRYSTGMFGRSAAERIAYDAGSRSLFVVSATQGVEILDLSYPPAPTPIGVIRIAGVTSVAARDGLVAVAIPDPYMMNNGTVRFYGISAAAQGSVTVGMRPAMATFTPDGTRLLVANEGPPNETYTMDGEGSVSIVDLTRGPKQARVATADFRAWNDRKDALVAKGVRVYGPRASVAQDLEPEWIAVSPDSKTAYVVLQENNALAVVDIDRVEVTAIEPFGEKSHDMDGRGLDASDKDGRVHIARWPVMGMYQPATIATYEADGHTYLVTANRGAARASQGFNEVKRVAEVKLDPKVFPNAQTLQSDENLGRLHISAVAGDTDGDGDHDRLFSFGGRSFAIWRLDRKGALTPTFDSGDAFEQITAKRLPRDFNADSHANDTFDTRSDDRGPEPRALAVGRIGERTYAFVALARIGGIVIYDVTNPADPVFQSYTNQRDFKTAVNPDDPDTLAAAGDLGPTDMLFISADQNAMKEPLLVVASNVSGTVTLYRLTLKKKAFQPRPSKAMKIPPSQLDFPYFE